MVADRIESVLQVYSMYVPLVVSIVRQTGDTKLCIADR